MSTNLKPVSELSLTRYWGGHRRGMCIQLLQSDWRKGNQQLGYVTISKGDIPELIEAFAQIMQDTREQEE